MAQVFGKNADDVLRFVTTGGLLGLAVLFFVLTWLNRSDYPRREEMAAEQPVQFSHRHHVSELGIHCRYCHTSAETASTAGMPTLQTCMTCHSQIWNDSPMLEPVRAGFAAERPIQWRRVHDLPDFVYFDHEAHVENGVGCETCHGRVDRMALTAQRRPLRMQWCLDCHRSPARRLRPEEHVYTFGYEPAVDDPDDSTLIETYDISVDPLDDCYTCHR